MSMYKKLIGSLTISLLFLLSATPSFAQQNDVKVTGKITDGSGAPLAGVVVVVKDGKSNNGAVSNTQGVYEIKVPASSTLLFTCLGYTDQEVKLGASNVVNVTMTEDAQSLDEVVVVGYGTQKKKDLTGGLAVVSKQTLEMVSTNNLMDRLVGQVAGLNITTGNEAPGSNQPLLIRGQNSLTASNDPLIILDGIPYSGGLADLDPNIIENMSVLKDASAVAIYGSRGSNGVIVITTKKGKKDKIRISYKGNVGIASRAIPRYDLVDMKDYVEMSYEALRNSAQYGTGMDFEGASRYAAANLGQQIGGLKNPELHVGDADRPVDGQDPFGCQSCMERELAGRNQRQFGHTHRTHRLGERRFGTRQLRRIAGILHGRRHSPEHRLLPLHGPRGRRFAG